MKGTYVNTVIWMAARSGRKASKQSLTTETTTHAIGLTSPLQNHRIIWMKSSETTKTRAAKTATLAC